MTAVIVPPTEKRPSLCTVRINGVRYLWIRDEVRAFFAAQPGRRNMRETG